MRYKRIHTILKIIVMIIISTYSILAQSNSQNALIRRQIFSNPPIWRLTRSMTNNEWGITLYGNPRASAQSYIMNPSNVLYTAASFVIDQDWNRFVYTEVLDYWIRANGSYGSGLNQFALPRSIDAIAPFNDIFYSYYYFIYVLDSDNYRISKFVYDWQYQNVDTNGNICEYDLYEPIDFDLNNNYDFWPHTNDYIWVLDGSKKLMRFDLNGNLFGTYGTYGCSGATWEFCCPTAVISGRSWDLEYPYDPGANNTHVYVADPGNERIVWIIKTTGAETALWYQEIQTDPASHIVDLETDVFGHLWTVDMENDLITKYTYDLFPLCTFGGTGIGTNEFVRPVNLRVTGGYKGCGNVLVLEPWSDTTGENYFAIGTDIVDFDVSTIENQNIHYIYFVLIDPSLITLKIYNQSQVLVKTILDGAYLSGEFFKVWDGSDEYDQQLPTGDYHIVIEATCNYTSFTTGQPVNVVTKDEWVHHVYCYDSDLDGFGDPGHPENECPLDNCPSIYNPGQEDNDSNGIGNACCCIGYRGNADCSLLEEPDVSDITRIIDHLYLSKTPLCCPDEADVNGSCTTLEPDVSDINYLIAYLYNQGPQPAQCDECQ